jgi:hypothetical protein
MHCDKVRVSQVQYQDILRSARHCLFKGELRMKIRSDFGIPPPAATGKIASRQGTSSIQFSLPDHANIADPVTQSNEVKVPAAKAGKGEPTRTTAQNRLIGEAMSSPQDAAKLAYDMAHVNSQIVYNLRDSPPNGPFRLAVTGEFVTDEYKANFARTAPLIDQQRTLLYETEKAKGTNPVEILKKMFDFTNSQPRSYREATGQVEEAWGLGRL